MGQGSLIRTRMPIGKIIYQGYLFHNNLAGRSKINMYRGIVYVKKNLIQPIPM